MTVPIVKIITPWFGDLPPWYDKFKSRFNANKLFIHDVTRFDSVQSFNDLVYQRTGYHSHKQTPHSTCDLRPLFGHIFDFSQYTFWGWCDLDIVVGNLDSLWGKLLPHHDILTTDPYTISGPLTILHNTPDICSLYKAEPTLTNILIEPDYCNFDEVGFNTEQQLQLKQPNPNPNFSQIIKSLPLRTYHDDRVWTDTHNTLRDNTPGRGCEIKNTHLLETPTRRDLVIYHFNSKRWPIPDKHYRRSSERLQKWIQDIEEPLTPTTVLNPLPETVEFWANRIQERRDNEHAMHYLSYNVSYQQWDKIQKLTKDILDSHIQPGQSILDAGCGYAPLLLLLSDRKYHGVDFCPGMLEIAKVENPNTIFTLADLRSLPFIDHQFDWCVCRSLEGSIKTYHGNKDWAVIRSELLRVSKNTLLIEYDGTCRVLNHETYHSST